MKSHAFLLAFILPLACVLGGCENYSSPLRDEQGRLNDRFKSGELSREEYAHELERLRGNGGDTPLPRHYSVQY